MAGAPRLTRNCQTTRLLRLAPGLEAAKIRRRPLPRPPLQQLNKVNLPKPWQDSRVCFRFDVADGLITDGIRTTAADAATDQNSWAKWDLWVPPILSRLP